eukprot:1189202-Prorocentrum_minimum.AAC.2
MAARALSNLVENSGNQVVIMRAGAVKPLVQLLHTGDAEGKAQAAQVLSNLSICNSDNQVAIARAGAVEPLVQLLRTGDAAGNTIMAAWALASGPRYWCSCCALGTRRGRLRQRGRVQGALNNLAVNLDNKVAIAWAEALEPLVQLLRTGDAAGNKIMSAWALRCEPCDELRRRRYKTINK